MKKNSYAIVAAISMVAVAQTVSAQVTVLTDNFTVSGQSSDPNFEYNLGRQGGTAASSPYTSYGGDDNGQQVGNNGTAVGQPGGAGNANYLLLAFDGGVQNNLDITTVATGPLTISFDLYKSGNPLGSPDNWFGAFTLRAAGSDPWPIVANGEFGFLNRVNGGVQVFNGGGSIFGPDSTGWDTVGLASSDHWSLIFTDTAGTGSAFNGNGSQVTMVNGATTLGTVTLAQLNSSNLELGFRAFDNLVIGIDNLSISVAPVPEPSAALLVPVGFGLLALVRRHRRA